MRSVTVIPVLAAVQLLVARPASAGIPLQATYDDDFILEAADGAFQLKIRGNIHFDFRAYMAEDTGAPHSFDIRRARIDLQGRLFRWITFRLQPEFAGTPYIRNAWVDFGPLPWLHVRAGQMKVPFSSSWLTLDNNVNFIERGTSTPVHPFFDRGATLWGEILQGSLVYNVGVYTGAGVDGDAASGDIDDFKDLAARLFLQPFRLSRHDGLRGLFLVVQGTWGMMSVPTSRHDLGGLRSANYETAIWLWRTEKLIATDGRVRDLVSAAVEQRIRAGAELHYLFGPFALSVEYLEAHYRGITLYHELFSGSSRQAHARLLEAHGAIRSLSAFAAVYLTGEGHRLTNTGWKTARPRAPLGQGGPGAWELLARYSLTWTGESLFDTTRVQGYAPGDPELPAGYSGPTPGTGGSVVVSILDGAHQVHELSLGLNWTLNPMVRLQLDDVFLWAPASDRDGDGRNDNTLVSGARSNQSDPTRKNARVSWENAVMLRLIFKL